MTARPLVIAALALVALGLSGCADSASDTAPEPTTATTEHDAEPGTGGAELTGPGASRDCDGIGVIVDAGDLDAADDPSIEACLPADEALVAADALTELGVTIEGTDDYGDQVVCRVNGAPAESDTIIADDGSEYHETCATMPAAFAYWALWVQPAGGEWAYAQEGLATQQLQPGERLGLFFTLNGNPAQPGS